MTNPTAAFIVSLPFLDHTGALSPLVIDAIDAGALSAHDPNDADRITLTFADHGEAESFATLASLTTIDPSDVGFSDWTQSSE